ncbi:uncharacterized protein [Elaeis guineensis]|uniref:uncharacterized protein n=1 Tax=Elaeis guineensis var. tenera TaxID=51953 RepID=UPI003C6D3D3E
MLSPAQVHVCASMRLSYVLQWSFQKFAKFSDLMMCNALFALINEMQYKVLVPAVTELVIAEMLYLQWMDPKQPIYPYINSTGTTCDDGETVYNFGFFVLLFVYFLHNI